MPRAVVKSPVYLSYPRVGIIIYAFILKKATRHGKSKDTPYYDVIAKRKSIACLSHMVKKWLRMWKNNKATEPARINRRIKSTSMASTGRKAKLREKTKVSREKCSTVASDASRSLKCVASIHVLRV